MRQMRQQPPPNFDIKELESLLDRVVTELIAHDLNVEPEDITPEFILRWRDEHLYPVANIDLSTLYGGYNGAGRRALTGAEVTSNRLAAEEFFNRF